MYPLPDPDPRRYRRRRPIARAGSRLAACITALVLAVPMFAQAGPGLAPSAAPSGCRPLGIQAQCAISVAFNSVAGADYYTATVTTPTGAVFPYSQIANVGEGRISATLSFIYTGDGVHSVTVQAWGVDEAGSSEQIDSEQAGTELGGEAKSEPSGEKSPKADEAEAEENDGETTGGSAKSAKTADEEPVAATAEEPAGTEPKTADSGESAATTAEEPGDVDQPDESAPASAG